MDDEFDDIFLDSTGENDVPVTAAAAAEEDSSSSDSDSSSDESSVESVKNSGLFNSSKAVDRSCHRDEHSNSDSEEIEPDEPRTKADNEGQDQDSDDEFDDDALIEFFSSSPKSVTQKTPAKQVEKKPVFELDDESDSEDEIVEKKERAVFKLDVFDLSDDDLADLEEDDDEVEVIEKAEGDTNELVEKTEEKQDSPEQEEAEDDDDLDLTPKKMEEDESVCEEAGNKTPYRITYNGEKKKCPVEDALFDFSDDESLGASRRSKSKSSSANADMATVASKSSSHSSVRSSSLNKSSNDGDKENDASKNTPRINPYQKNKKQTQAKEVPHSISPLPSAAPTSTATLSPQTENSFTTNKSELQRLNINHAHFKPPKYTPRPDPILHKLDKSNRPIQRRRKIPVGQIFSRPYSNMFTCKFQEFNHLQSEMANVIANSDDNVIVSSPTGSGKTALFEMAMCRLFASTSRGNRVVTNSKKIVYIAPSKALCEERQSDWSKRLMEIDPTIVCTTITGDANTAASSYGEIALANLILTTPEKWDSITRRWSEYVVLLGSIKLVVLDEVHMIGEPERGACLESVISRMKTVHRAATSRQFSSSEIESSSFNDTNPETLASNLRFVAVSATLPNLDQLASFIEAGEAYAFDDSYRPVPLYTHVQACGHIGKNRYLFDKGLNQHVPSILHRYSKGRPSIIFCHSKKETEQLADELSKSYSNSSSLNASTLNEFANRASSSALQRFIRCGMAYHHAGLELSDRKVVEEAFMSGSIVCLCATSTLAMGVNLPSHLVIVKGTSAYRGANNGHQDIDTGTLLQMIGRAGRPGFDTSGTAVIMTDSASKQRFENLSHGLKVVESHLLDDDKLTEALNSEIAQGVITSQEEAMDWASGTLLFRRLQVHPLFYGLNGNDAQAFIAKKCQDSIEQMRKIGAIVIIEDGTFSPSAASNIMSRNFLDLQTMKSITKLPHDSGPHQLLHLLANCAKLQSPVRRNEKKHLNEAYKQIRYKLEGPQSKIRIQTPAEKVYVLLQSAIGNHHFEDFSLRQEMTNVLDRAVSILTAIEEYSREGSRHGQVLTQSYLLRRSIFHGIWGDGDGVLKQIGGVTHALESKLEGNGISSFEDVVESSSEDISKACGMPSSFGHNLRAAASMILQCTLKLVSFTEESEEGLDLIIKLERPEHVAQSHTKDNVSYSLLVFTDRPGGLLLSCQDVSEESELRVRCPKKFGRAYIRLISNLVGLDEQASVDGNDRIEKSSFHLSPTIVKSTTKSKKSQATASKPSQSTAKKRLFESHGSSVSNINDLRLHKRGKQAECIEINSDNEEDQQSSLAFSKSKSAKKAVTPSPHPPASKQSQNINLTPTFGSRSMSQQNNIGHINPYSSKKPSSGMVTQHRSSKWTHDKRDHKIKQQGAFQSPKDNPFSSYGYDPNNIETNLNSKAAGSKQAVPSILPTRSNFSSKKPRLNTFRTPANRRKSAASSSRISSVGLLKQKAMEMNHLHQKASSHFIDRGSQRQMDAPMPYARQYHGGLEEEPMQSDMSFYNHHQHQTGGQSIAGYGSGHSYGMGSRPGFTQALDYDAPYSQSQCFSRGDYDDALPSGPTYEPHTAHFMRNNHNDAPLTQRLRDQQSVNMYDRPMSSAGHSNGSGLQRFSRQNHALLTQTLYDQQSVNMYERHAHHRQQHQHQSYPNFNQSQLMEEDNTFHMNPYMQSQMHDNYAMASQVDQRMDYFENSFGRLDPANSEQFEPEYNQQPFTDFGITQHQPRTNAMAVRNPYAQQSQQSQRNMSQQIEPMFATEPPKEIVVQNQNQILSKTQNNAADDASLAFDDAFL